MHLAIGDYVVRHLGVTPEEADALRQRYWQRYGATLLGLVRHHGIRAAHFLEETHRMPGLEARLRGSAPDRAALSRLPGRKYILTNAPRAYAMRVLDTLDLTHRFDGVITIEDMTHVRHASAQARCAHVPPPGGAAWGAGVALRPGRRHAAASEVGALARHAYRLDAALARRRQRRLVESCEMAASQRGKTSVEEAINRHTCVPESVRFASSPKPNDPFLRPACRHRRRPCGRG